MLRVEFLKISGENFAIDEIYDKSQILKIISSKYRRVLHSPECQKSCDGDEQQDPSKECIVFVIYFCDAVSDYKSGIGRDELHWPAKKNLKNKLPIFS